MQSDQCLCSLYAETLLASFSIQNVPREDSDQTAQKQGTGALNLVRNACILVEMVQIDYPIR